MSKYGMNNLQEEVENIKLESDSIYLQDIPTERSIYDFYNEIEHLGQKGIFIDNKVHMMSDIMVDMISLKEKVSVPCKTESDFSSSNVEISTKLFDITNRVSECLKGTDCEVGNSPQAFKPNYVDIKFESFDGMDFNSKLNYRMEGIGDVFSKIWEYIKKFFKWVWESIKKLFNSIFNLFRSNRKLLANLKLELEKMNLESGERSEFTASKQLIFFTQILNDTFRTSYLENIEHTFEKVKEKQKEYIDEITGMVKTWKENIITNKTDLTSVKKSIDDFCKIENMRFTNNTDSSPKTRIFHNGDTKAVNIGKFRDPGNYYLIGVDGDDAAFLMSPNGVYSDITRASILDNSSSFSKKTPEQAKQELIDMCELGINICDAYDKNTLNNVESDLKGQESDMINVIETIEGLVQIDANEFGEDSNRNGKEITDTVTREMQRLVSGLTKNINRSTSSIIAALSVVAKQPTYIIKSVKEGMYTIE